jgi:hypothetical protein
MKQNNDEDRYAAVYLYVFPEFHLTALIVPMETP